VRLAHEVPGAPLRRHQLVVARHVAGQQHDGRPLGVERLVLRHGHCAALAAGYLEVEVLESEPEGAGAHEDPLVGADEHLSLEPEQDRAAE
jgi:hypothetical protein